MTFNRNTLILAGLALGLVGLLMLGIQFGSTGPSGYPSTHTSTGEGALALYRWLGGMGYNVDRLQYQAFTLDRQTDLLFVLGPSVNIGAAEADIVLEWVTNGGTLVLAEDRLGNFSPSGALLRTLDVELMRVEPTTAIVPVVQPVFSVPPVTQLRMESTVRIVPTRNDLAILAANATGVTLVGFQVGEGYVYLSSALTPFTNEGIGRNDNAALVLNILRRVPPDARIRFDEIHHGFIREPSLRDLVLGSPWGWAGLYALGVLAVFAVVGGRRFGRPLPLREETVRRSSAEYVESMAGLLRRGRKTAYVLEHYRTDFKRRLARPYGINPQLDNAAFAREMAEARPDLDPAHLHDLLNRMDQSGISDSDLLRLIAEADRLLTP